MGDNLKIFRRKWGFDEEAKVRKLIKKVNEIKLTVTKGGEERVVKSMAEREIFIIDEFYYLEEF